MIGYEHFRVERHEDTMVVQFLDRRVVAELAITDVGEELYAVASRPDCRKLVLNFCAVEFLSSAMLGKLAIVKKMIAAKGGLFILCEICPNIRLILKLTAMERIFDIRDAEAEAVAFCAN
jgi:anti-sigma B factor antagonist